SCFPPGCRTSCREGPIFAERRAESFSGHEVRQPGGKQDRPKKGKQRENNKTDESKIPAAPPPRPPIKAPNEVGDVSRGRNARNDAYEKDEVGQSFTHRFVPPSR